MTALPTTFVLHIATRHSATDPFSGYIMLNAAQHTPVGPWTLTLASPAGPHTIHNGPMDVPLISATQRCNLQNMADPAIVLRKTVQTTTRTVRNEAGQSFPIVIIPQHTGILLPRIKRNFQITSAPPVVVPAVQHVAPAVQHVAPAVQPPRRLPPTELPLFVARQLLELAQLKHDQCPIVAEEFSAGNTAVMPCGHLFAQMAIEESFTSTPNVCPACRQPGRPTYV